MSTCMDVIELLGVYALGAASAEENARVERHLMRCPECLAEGVVLTEVASDLAELLRRTDRRRGEGWP